MSSSWGDSGGDGGSFAPQFVMPSMTPMVRRIVHLTGGVFLATWVLSLISEPAWVATTRIFGLDPTVWVGWVPLLPVWQLLTYGLLHSTGGLGHILSNLLVLYFLGTLLEGILGERRMLAHYAAGLAVAGGVSLAAKLPAALGQSAGSLPTVGASGAVFAVLVATACLRPNARIILIVIPLRLKTFALLYVGIEAFGALNGVFKGGGSFVDYYAHLGGAAYGFAAVRLGWIWRDPLAALEARRVRRRERHAEEAVERMDELLERIHKEGMGSLSEREREFLRRMSKRR